MIASELEEKKMYLLHELKRYIRSRYFLFSILLSAIVFFIGAHGAKAIIESEGGLALFLTALSFGPTSVFPILAPMIAIFPVYYVYAEEQEGNFATAWKTRISEKGYYLNKFFATGITGALAMVLPVGILLLITVMMYGTGNAFVGTSAGAFASVFDQSQLTYSLIWLGVLAVFGFVYANLCFAASLLVNNKYGAIAVVYAIYILPSFILPFLGLDVFEPSVTASMSLNTNSTPATVFGELFFLLILSVLVGLPTLKRKFHHE